MKKDPNSTDMERKKEPFKRILILAANPKATPRLRLDEEVREIEEGLQRAKHRERFDIRSKWAVRFKDLRRALLDYEPHIVHFVGHGEKKGIALEDEIGFAEFFSAKRLTGLFELCSNHVECVILSACYSASYAKAISKHIKYVIGMTQDINDKAAIEFSVGFYDALGAGKSFEEAFEFGQTVLKPEHSAILKKKPIIPDKSTQKEKERKATTEKVQDVEKTGSTVPHKIQKKNHCRFYFLAFFVLLMLIGTMIVVSNLGRNGLCPFQAKTDEATIKNLINAESDAVNKKDISIIKRIFAHNAVIEDKLLNQRWTDPINRYQNLFISTNFIGAQNSQIQPVVITGQNAKFTSASKGSYFETSNPSNIQSYDNNPGSNEWEFQKNSNGCWVITRFTFNIRD